VGKIQKTNPASLCSTLNVSTFDNCEPGGRQGTDDKCWDHIGLSPVLKATPYEEDDRAHTQPDQPPFCPTSQLGRSLPTFASQTSSFSSSQLMAMEAEGQMGHLSSSRPSMAPGEGLSGGKRPSAQKLGLAQLGPK
jgi:hypothetical protein